MPINEDKLKLDDSKLQSNNDLLQEQENEEIQKQEKIHISNKKLLNSQNQSKQPFVGRLDQAPSFMSENPFLLSGYRINFTTYKQIFKSLFMMHNDTFNIWSHLMGTVIVILSIFYEQLNATQNEDLTKIPIYIFFAGSIVMFMSSAIMHLLYCKSKKVCTCVVKLDYTGIAICGLGKGLTFTFYALYCNTYLNIGYNTFWTLSCLVLFVLSSLSSFHKPQYKSIKIGLFMALAAGFIVPVAHILILNANGMLGNYNPMEPFHFVMAYNMLLVLGVVIAFVIKFPERYFPLKFDIYFNSHTIWHLCVVGDFLLNYYAARLNYDQRSENMVCPVSN